MISLPVIGCLPHPNFSSIDQVKDLREMQLDGYFLVATIGIFSNGNNPSI